MEQGVRHTLLDILNAVDRVCEDNFLEYFLMSDTLLGAVLYRGFAPGADSITIAMERREYERFVYCALSDLPEKYILRMHAMDPDYKAYCGCPCKVVDAASLREDFNDVGEPSDRGVSVNIFPLDKHHPKNLCRDTDMWKRFVRLHRIIYKRRNSPVLRIFHAPAVLAAKVMMRIYMREAKILIDENERRCINYCLTPGFDVFWNRVSVFRFRDIYPLGRTEFEGCEFPVPKDCNAVLHALFGVHYKELTDLSSF